jgi:hypothetical protein
MYLPTAGGSAYSYFGERSGAGVTALTPLEPFDQPPDISTLPIFGTSPNPTPIFRAETRELDWFRFAALAIGILIGWKLLK